MLIELINDFNNVILVIPRALMHELEGLKRGDTARALAARAMIRFVHRRQQDQDPQIRVQRFSEKVGSSSPPLLRCVVHR